MKLKYKINPYAMLVLVSLLTGIILYYQFIFGDKVLAYAAWGSDTRQSYIPTYEFWYNRIIQGRFSIYDFSYGWGTNVFPVLWGVVDPFSLIPILFSVLLGVDFIGKSLVYFQILKSCIISLLGLKYLKNLGYSYKGAFIPAYILGYCGYMIVTGEHYFFSTYAVFFMLILLYTEKTLQTRKFSYALCSSIAALSVLSAYAMFQTALAIGLYVVLRNLLVSKQIKEYISNVVLILKTAVVGVLLGMFGFIMQAYNIFVVSGRTESDVNFIRKIIDACSLLSKGLIKETVYNLFSSNLLGTINNYKGSGGARFYTTPYFFSCIFSFALIFYIVKTISTTKKDRRTLIRYILLFVGGVVLFSCFYVLLTNLFVYLQWRYVFTIIPFFAWIVADLLEDILNKQKVSLFVCVIPVVMALCILLNCDMQISGAKESAICMFVVTCVIAILLFCYIYIPKLHNTGIIGGLLLFVIAVNILMDDGIVIYKDQQIMTKAELKNRFRDSRIGDILGTIEQEEKDNFYRIDRTYADMFTPNVMLSFVQPARTLSVYDSTINTNLVNAVTTLSNTYFYTQEGYNIGSCGVKFDPFLADIYGLKYIISEHERDVSGWELYSKNKGLYVYKNTKLTGAGLLYKECITEHEYENLNQIEKCFAAQKYLIVDDSNADECSKADIDYTDVSKRIVDIEYKKHMDKIYLEADTSEMMESICMKSNVTGESGQTVTFVFYNQDKEKLDTKQITLLEETETIVSKVPQDAAIIKVKYDKKKTSISDVKLYNSFERNYINNGLELQNPKMGSMINGTIETNEDSYLLLPVPYESCWKIKINGKNTDYKKADFGFMMVEIPAGTNTISIQYENTVYKIGLGISLFVLIGLYLYYLKNKRKEHNDDQKRSCNVGV